MVFLMQTLVTVQFLKTGFGKVLRVIKEHSFVRFSPLMKVFTHKNSLLY